MSVIDVHRGFDWFDCFIVFSNVVFGVCYQCIGVPYVLFVFAIVLSVSLRLSLVLISINVFS